MRIQQSAYGLCQPLVYGKTRVAANISFGMEILQLHLIQQFKKSGGKGGGTKPVIPPLVIAPLMLGL